ncbi:MAG: hypothetical protein RML36_15280 [Anaerolineae bacterium]|nr:hypothetical protein [Anaerolineae bacterium]
MSPQNEFIFPSLSESAHGQPTFMSVGSGNVLLGSADDDDNGAEKPEELYYELDGSPMFDMRASRVERHDVTRMFLCRREAIPHLVELACNNKLDWGDGPSYYGDIIGVRLIPAGGLKGDKVASYDWWRVELLYGQVMPTAFNRAHVFERVIPTVIPAPYVVDEEIYARGSYDTFYRVATQVVLEGAALTGLKLQLGVRNAIMFDASVLAMTGSINATPLMTIAHGIIMPRCAMFMGARTEIHLRLGYLPRWNVELEWSIKMTPWDTPVGLEYHAGNLWVKRDPSRLADSTNMIPFRPFRLAEHNYIYNAFGW